MQQRLTNIFPIDDIGTIRTALLAHKQTLAVAGNVTSGLLQAAFSCPANDKGFPKAFNLTCLLSCKPTPGKAAATNGYPFPGCPNNYSR